jgi:hypothetical protein
MDLKVRAASPEQRYFISQCANGSGLHYARARFLRTPSLTVRLSFFAAVLGRFFLFKQALFVLAAFSP